MRIVTIDPGTSNTGLVYMDERRILCARTLHFNGAVGNDQDALRERAGKIARMIADWIADKPHECVVMEGFVGFSGRQGGYTYQTPYLCGYLHKALEGEEIAIQTSRQVLNPRTRGNLAHLKDGMAMGKEVYPGCGFCTNDHLRSAAVHGIYYLKRKGIWKPER